MTDTRTLIDQLANDNAPASGSRAKRFVLPLMIAMATCAIAVLLVFGEPFRSVADNGLAPIIVKWGFSVALLPFCALALWVLGRPGRTSRWVMVALAIPFIPIVGLLVMELATVGPVLMGETWPRCLAAMSLMSPLAFAGAILAIRTLAPTRLRRSGFVAGLFGGAVAMTAYAPFCPELGMLWMFVFYCGPMALMALIGWLAGPRLLRW